MLALNELLVVSIQVHWIVLIFVLCRFRTMKYKPGVLKKLNFQVLKVALYDSNTLFLRISHIH